MKGIVRRQSVLVGLPAALLCLLLLAAWTSRAPHASSLDCPVIYNPGNGWLIDACPTDPQVETPMEVLLDGVSYGDAALVRIYHQSQAGPGFPQIAVLYASGYVRLKQNADPDPPIPFGSSFVLGPAYWPGPSTYHHNPQLNPLEIKTRWLPNGPLRLRAIGANPG